MLGVIPKLYGLSVDSQTFDSGVFVFLSVDSGGRHRLSSDANV